MVLVKVSLAQLSVVLLSPASVSPFSEFHLPAEVDRAGLHEALLPGVMVLSACPGLSLASGHGELQAPSGSGSRFSVEIVGAEGANLLTTPPPGVTVSASKPVVTKASSAWPSVPLGGVSGPGVRSSCAMTSTNAVSATFSGVLVHDGMCS